MKTLLTLLILTTPLFADEIRTAEEIAYAKATIAYEEKLLKDFESAGWNLDLRKLTPARRHEIFLAAAHFDLGLKRTRAELRGYLHYHPQYKARFLGIPLDTDQAFWTYYGCPDPILGHDPERHDRAFSESPEGYYDKEVQARRQNLRELVAFIYERRYESFLEMYDKDTKIPLPWLMPFLPYSEFEKKPLTPMGPPTAKEVTI